MGEKLKENWVSYAALVFVCSVVFSLLGSVISLRVYAGLPERLDEVAKRTERLENRIERIEITLNHELRVISVQLGVVDATLRRIEKDI